MPVDQKPHPPVMSLSNEGGANPCLPFPYSNISCTHTQTCHMHDCDITGCAGHVYAHVRTWAGMAMEWPCMSVVWRSRPLYVGSCDHTRARAIPGKLLLSMSANSCRSNSIRRSGHPNSGTFRYMYILNMYSACSVMTTFYHE